MYRKRYFISTYFGTSCWYRIRMASQDPKTFLWSNIALLMGTASPTVDAVQRKTQVGRGTVQRIKEGSTSTGTDTLLEYA